MKLAALTSSSSSERDLYWETTAFNRSFTGVVLPLSLSATKRLQAKRGRAFGSFKAISFSSLILAVLFSASFFSFCFGVSCFLALLVDSLTVVVDFVAALGPAPALALPVCAFGRLAAVAYVCRRMNLFVDNFANVAK